jgi:hypothetical protein
MKKINMIMLSALTVFAVTACHKEPSPQDSDNEYLVYTAPAKDVDFTQFTTFDIADSVLVIGQSDKPYYSKSNNALALVQQYRINMEKRGFIYTPSDPSAELGIQLTYVEKTERFVRYYSDPYWWLDYPGYWPSNYWGDWTGWYYPYPVSYTYTTNALITDIVDLTPVTAEDDSKPLTIVWSAYIGGPASASISNDIKRMQMSIDQAFAQSEYLKGAAE